ncbi:MAG: hypothetical protein WBA74_13785 [Cyclobacteriaceae bacterium]
MKKLLFILLLSVVIGSCSDDAESIFGNSSTSTGGSLASITIVGNHLYALNSTSIIPVDISDLSNPEVEELVTIGTGLETIFPYNDKLFIGSASALFIYDIENPARPQYFSFFSHATGCDPVVARGDYAYVTLRDGVSCNNPFRINVLEVVNVADQRNTFSTAQIELTNPRGLGIGCNNKLFVCDGEAGLLQFDLTDPSSPVLERSYDEYFANDVLIQDDLLILTGEDGVFQFRCTEEGLELLSKLPISI